MIFNYNDNCSCKWTCLNDLISNILYYLLFWFIVDISLVQDDEVGDGTTSVTVLACELLKV